VVHAPGDGPFHLGDLILTLKPQKGFTGELKVFRTIQNADDCGGRGLVWRGPKARAFCSRFRRGLAGAMRKRIALDCPRVSVGDISHGHEGMWGQLMSGEYERVRGGITPTRCLGRSASRTDLANVKGGMGRLRRGIHAA
jgi:hypothetical protein